jgi:Acetyl-CoA hydrolase/transferase C-terminal domain
LNSAREQSESRQTAGPDRPEAVTSEKIRCESAETAVSTRRTCCGAALKARPHCLWGLAGFFPLPVSAPHVQYIVTEFGVAYLHGKSIRERTAALIAIADPRYRDMLHAWAREQAYL